MRIPTWQDLAMSPEVLRRGINAWPPFLFAGIRVRSIDPGFTGATVELRLTPFSRNFMGTQFGGSMFAMTDPFWVIFLSNRLGREFVVWDKQAAIEFRRPGVTHVTVRFDIPQSFVDEVREAAADGSKVLRWVSNDVVDDAGQVVATVRREIYIRKRREA